MNFIPRAGTSRLSLAGLVLLLAGMVGHAAFNLGGSGLDDFFIKWIYNVVLLGSAGICLSRGALVREERAAWLVLGMSLLIWAAGNIYFTVALYDAQQVPIPSWSDAGWLAFYPGAYVSLVLLMRSRLTGLGSSLWLDGLIGALAMASVGAAFVLRTVLDTIGGDPVSVAIALAYPLLDLLLVALAAGALGMARWRLGRAWFFLITGFALFGVADGIYVYQNTVGSYTPGSLFDMGWPAAIVLLALAARQPSGQRPTEPTGAWYMHAPAALFGLTAVGVLVYGNLARPLDPVALTLAAATLVALIVRLGVTFTQNARLLRASRREALTDSLTDLGNRRRLNTDLAVELRTHDRANALLVLFDLDGFKSYNDTFGHPAGDALLARLGHNLERAAAPHGVAYRMGGDEFCVLADIGTEHAGPLVTQWSLALFEQGNGFAITASCGYVLLSEGASDPALVLRRADQRMYASKYGSRPSAGSQSANVLVAALQEHNAALREHGEGVAGAAHLVAEDLDLSPAEVACVLRAAKLHDIGKVAIPGAILRKPGRLDQREWSFIRRHTLIGERIISAAPALSLEARLVRSSHEHFDGSGYPDGLAGEDIPMGSRIISVCDAYDAIVSWRPYQAGAGVAAARAELRRCSGTQFDPSVVKAFLHVNAGTSFSLPSDAKRAERADPLDAQRS